MRSRNLNIDVLRGIAILLVLGAHYPISDHWARFAWSGVDLFFVISGFLVSGLLFREFERTGDVRLMRFWTRRAARIYPPFLVMIGVTAALMARFEPGHVGRRRLLAELTWTQNYWPGLWPHTWSLAVEEHFYVLLPLVFLPLLPRLRRWPWVVIAACALSLSLRSICVALGIERLPGGRWMHWFTPMRLDNLALGTLLAYAYHCRPEWLRRIEPYRHVLWILLLLGAVPITVDWQREAYVQSVGLLVLGIGFTALLTLAVTSESWDRLAVVAWVGRISYSTYLWHFAVAQWADPLATRTIGPMPHLAGVAIYLAGSVAVGWLMAKLVEEPAIALRDRLFPGRDRAASLALARTDPT